MSGPRTILGPQWQLALRYFVRLYSNWALFGAGTLIIIIFTPHVVSTLWRYVASPDRTVLDVVAFVTFGSFAVCASVLALIALRAMVRRAEQADFLEKIEESIESESRLLGRAEWADGANRYPGVISCRNDRLVFENADMITSVNARHIDYDTSDKLPNGESVEFGMRVLRIRSGDITLSFVVDADDAREWRYVLNLVVVKPREPDSGETDIENAAS